MPRRFIRRRRRFGKRRFTGKRRVFRKAVKRVIRGMSEIKYSYRQDAGNFDGATPQIFALTPSFVQGVGKNQRIGNQIQYKFMIARFSLYVLRGTVPVNQVAGIRSILFQLRLPLTSPTPVVQDILDENDWLSSVKNTNARVLSDKLFFFKPAAISGISAENNMPSGTTWRKKRRIRNKVNFKTTANTDPLDVQDQYYWMLVTNTGNVNDYTVSMEYFNKISFYDI